MGAAVIVAVLGGGMVERRVLMYSLLSKAGGIEGCTRTRCEGGGGYWMQGR